MISSPDFDAFGDDGIDCGDLKGDTAGLAELFADSADNRTMDDPLPLSYSRHGGAQNRARLPDRVIPIPRTLRPVPLRLPTLDNDAILLKHANYPVVLASVCGDENIN
jgi:hypothetical protein